jgi:hypothetical protein
MRRPARVLDAAELLLALDRLGGTHYVATKNELAAIDEALAQPNFASDAEIESAFARFQTGK